ncbi:uncharacterized protein LOC112679890 [Sipha flava]|uniref:Uncharacterized protein LOC112679890 n=1 Tax=Sipha flava TaxID=143950 RepID=A0A8B8F493_9HEMI|nr:uncharacterized protein LOC112679890 [Sipha flava]
MVRNEWLEFVSHHGIDRNQVLAMSKLCSRHFDDDDFRVTTVRRILRRHAVPRNAVLPDAPVAVVEDVVGDTVEVEEVTVNDVDLVDEQIIEEDLMANIVVIEELIAARVTAPAPARLFIGPMDRVCPHCCARHFIGEHYICCGDGKVLLTGDRALREVPLALRRLLSEDGPENRYFQNEVRQYNNAIAFASLVTQDFQAPPGRGPRTFVMHGQTYHLISDAAAGPDAIPRFCQLYFVDTRLATQSRIRNPVNSACRPDLLERLDILLREINPYAQMFMYMTEIWNREQFAAAVENPARPPRTVSMYFVRDSRDPGRRNEPAVREIAAVFIGNDGDPPENVDFVVYDRNPNPNVNYRRIPSTSRHTDPLLYPLLFPHGERGWATFMPHEGPRRTRVNQNVSPKDRFLFQQYVSDHYVRVEASRLSYLRNNQDQLRSESYQGLMDHLAVQDVPQDQQHAVGRRVILPSSFAGSPRSMQLNYQDAMAIVRKFGKPDLFITFTCNPRWPEIVENLPPRVVSSDRPELVSRVFNLKLQDLMRDITEHHIFGRVEAFVYVVEFQKRGLPHAHILLILQEMYKPKVAEDVDQLIRTEIPDPDTERELYDIVVTNMMHGPYGVLNPVCSCMVDGKCQKDFPKPFNSKTQFRSAGGYPAYRRRDNGRAALVRNRELFNDSVVPYNPYLLLKYNAHINVEVCSTVKSVIYL